MSTVTWTPAQQAAIDDRGGSLLLSAAAGSGKTAVLVERVVELLRDPHDPVDADQLLIVTFTNAAAAELRARIHRRLTRLIRENPDDTGLRRQRMLLQRASICTIDAFCLHLLQTHFAALDIPPDFSTIDENACTRLRQDCLQQVLERAYENPDFCAFSDLYGRGRSDERAGQIVLKLYDFLRSLPDPGRTLEQLCAMWRDDRPMEETEWCAVLMDIARGRLESALALAGLAVQTAQQSDAAAEKYRPVLLEDQALLERLCDLAKQPGSWTELYRMLRAVEWARMPTIRGGKDAEAERAAELRTAYKGILKTLAEDVFLCTQQEYQEDRRTAAPLVEALAAAVRDFEQTFYAAKLEEKTLEFSDFEHLALKLLRAEDGGPTPLGREIAAGIRYVMVDEYQDSNALQDAIYHLLASPQKDNLFFVGDLKQSIYRFRQADPGIFLEKEDRFKPLGEGYPAKIALDANFRSAPGVVDGINFIFEQIMSRSLGGIAYGPGQRLVAGSDTHGYPGICMVQMIRTADTALEAKAIARKIRAMLAEGFLVRDGEETRPCQAGDFCILLRSRHDFETYAAALERAGLPVYADVNENLLDALPVRPFAALLRVLDNPAQDVCLAAVMLSPLFGFEPDDLVRLRARNPQEKKTSLYGALLRSEDERVCSFVKSLEQMRRLARTLPVERLIEELFAQTGYLAAVGALPDGERRRDQLRAFVAWAAGAGKGGLSALVRAMDAAEMSENGVNAGQNGQTRSGCVSVMTIHRSKGLEFPILFVADLAHPFNLRDTSDPVLFHSRLGLGLNLRGTNGNNYSTLAHQALHFQLIRESMSEEMRILYVALTRARDALILSLPLPDPEKTLRDLAPYALLEQSREYRLLKATNSAIWLLMALLHHPDAESLRQAAGMFETPRPAAGKMCFAVLDADEEETPCAAQSLQPDAPPDEELLEQIRQNFAWRSPQALLQEVPAKVSVTGLIHDRQQAQLERPAFEYAQGLTGAEKGTALHAFLQNADLDAAAQDPQAEAERQKRMELLDPALYDSLDMEALRTFFASGVFRRMQSAQKILREYDFITSVPASAVMQDKDADYKDAKVLVQGVADVVLVFADHAEILDYKTDRGVTPETLVQRYAPQLWLYRAAVEKRLTLPVTRCTLYSFSLGREVEVPLL